MLGLAGLGLLSQGEGRPDGFFRHLIVNRHVDFALAPLVPA